jgi:RNA polymerase sigma-70 factor (ECF subfamily)
VGKAARELVAELCAGSAAGFDDAYTRYRTALFNFLVRLCGDRTLAEDLFQNTWLKLARRATRLREDTDLRAWLFTVARNEYRSHRRWQRMDLIRLLAAHSAGSAAPIDEATNGLRDLGQALSRLSVADREVLLLIGVEGFEPRQAATVLGISYEAVRQRLARARAHLAERLVELEG